MTVVWERGVLKGLILRGWCCAPPGGSRIVPTGTMGPQLSGCRLHCSYLPCFLLFLCLSLLFFLSSHFSSLTHPPLLSSLPAFPILSLKAQTHTGELFSAQTPPPLLTKLLYMFVGPLRCEVGMFRRRDGTSELSTVGGRDKSKDGGERCTREDMLRLVGGRVWVVGEMKWSSHFVDFETQAHMLS